MVTMQPAPGSLLIASATLLDPNFARCVLLVLDSDSNGSLGVILNRPSEVPVDEVLAPWRDIATAPPVLFRGGPVELNAALAVGSIRSGSVPDEDLPPGWRPLTGALGIIDLDSPPDEFLGKLAALRVYAGYTGWGAEQLEGEIAEGSWHVVPALEGDAFSSDPDRLWRDVLRRQPSPLSMLATLPEDANLN